MVMNGRKRAVVRAAIAMAQENLATAATFAEDPSELQNGTDAAMANAVREAGLALDAARKVME